MSQVHTSENLIPVFSGAFFYCLMLMWRYHGNYLGEDVAVKVLRAEHLNKNVWNEFTQEVYILRYLTYCWITYDLCDVLEYLMCYSEFGWNDLMMYGMPLPPTLFREVQHTNVVRFIGACTKPPQFCIITGEIYVSVTGCNRNLHCLSPYFFIALA